MQEAEAQRLQQRHLRQRRRRLLLAGGGVALVGFIVALVFVTRVPQVGETVTILSGTHNPPYEYNTRPPTSGNHLPTTAPYGFKLTPLQAEAAVHNMEHGGLVIWFQPGDDALAAQVRDLVFNLGRECLVAGPYAEMEGTVAVTGWGRILQLDDFDADKVKEFVQAYRGDLGPEAGICKQES